MLQELCAQDHNDLANVRIDGHGQMSTKTPKLTSTHTLTGQTEQQHMDTTISIHQSHNSYSNVYIQRLRNSPATATNTVYTKIEPCRFNCRFYMLLLMKFNFRVIKFKMRPNFFFIL